MSALDVPFTADTTHLQEEMEKYVLSGGATLHVHITNQLRHQPNHPPTKAPAKAPTMLHTEQLSLYRGQSTEHRERSRQPLPLPNMQR